MCRSKSFRYNRETNSVQEKEKEDSDADSTDRIFNIYRLSLGDKQEPYRINVVINSMEVTMEIDTGAPISIIFYNMYLHIYHRNQRFH